MTMAVACVQAFGTFGSIALDRVRGSQGTVTDPTHRVGPQ